MLSKLKDLPEYLALRGLIGLIQFLPISIQSTIGYGLGLFVATLPLKMNRVARQNLHRVYPGVPVVELIRIQMEALGNLFRTAMEFHAIYTMPTARFNETCILLGKNFLDSHPNAFILTAHFGNWEVINRAVAEAGYPMASIYRAANNQMVDNFITNLRGRTKGLLIPKGAQGARTLIKTAKTGKMLIGFLNDQKLNNGIAAPFLGQDAMCAPALAELARKFDRPVLPVFCTREVGRWGKIRFIVRIGAPLNLQKTSSAEDDVLTNTTLFNHVMEDAINANPEQWLWAHKRF